MHRSVPFCLVMPGILLFLEVPFEVHFLSFFLDDMCGFSHWWR